jgi:hypothetical protein
MIKELTPQQELDVAIYVRKYTDIGTNTDETDRTVTTEIDQFYKWMGKEAPYYIWVDNPYEARVVLTAMSSGKDFPNLDFEIDGKQLISRRVIEDVAKKLEKIENFDYIMGNLNTYWISYLNYGRESLGIQYDYGKFDPTILDVWTSLIKKTGYFYAMDKYCVVCNRPQVLHFDENRELHCQDGPAVKFRRGDECTIYAIHGVNVPENIILNPSAITVEDVNNQENAEIRRIMIDQMGTERYLLETGAVVIHKDTTFTDYVGGKQVPRVLVEDKEGRKFLVASDGGTGRVYHMQVPKKCTTCKEASNALCPEGMTEDDFIAVG